MIQRIQTVYLVIAVILMVVCSCLPVGTFFPLSMGGRAELYNIGIISAEGWDCSVAGLFVLLLATTVNSVLTIFAFNNRKRQIRNCTISIILLLLWMALYAVLGFVVGKADMEFHMDIPAVLPVVSIIFIWLARRAVIADEKLIRSVDRIR